MLFIVGVSVPCFLLLLLSSFIVEVNVLYFMLLFYYE